MVLFSVVICQNANLQTVTDFFMPPCVFGNKQEYSVLLHSYLIYVFVSFTEIKEEKNTLRSSFDPRRVSCSCSTLHHWPAPVCERFSPKGMISICVRPQEKGPASNIRRSILNLFILIMYHSCIVVYYPYHRWYTVNLDNRMFLQQSFSNTSIAQYCAP